MKFKLPYVLLITLFNYGSTFASPEDPACRLNFTTFPYLPVGGCGNIDEEIQDWNGFPKTTCCQNALIFFSHALALRVFEDPQRHIFIGRDEWNGCSGPFRLQPQVSAQSCGFQDFFYKRGKCSMLQLTNIDQNVMTHCSFSSSSFDDACGKCTDAISREVDNMVKSLNVEGNDTEKGLCLVALIISVIAGKLNDTSGVVDFDRCLPALLVPAPVKCVKLINRVVAEAILAVILVFFGFTAIILVIKFVKKNQKSGKRTPYFDVSASCSSLYRFTKAEIESAISYGQERKFLGRGRTGLVYRGILPSGQVVAIKQMYPESNTSDVFTREIEELSRYRHPNLVSILGFCIEDGEQDIVYEYCPNGNLAQHLLRKGTGLTWELRVKILRDCALALKHLHCHSDGSVVHRNVKLSNILLTHDMNPKLSDFGLEKLLGSDDSKVLNYAVGDGIMGYRAYMDPDYMSLYKPTTASDIYCFGIVSLQLLSGQKVIDCDLDARDQLTTKAKAVIMGKRPLIDFQDPRIRGDVTVTDFERILQLVVLCVAKSTAGRPAIDLVFDELDNIQAEMIARK